MEGTPKNFDNFNFEEEEAEKEIASSMGSKSSESEGITDKCRNGAGGGVGKMGHRN